MGRGSSVSQRRAENPAAAIMKTGSTTFTTMGNRPRRVVKRRSQKNRADYRSAVGAEGGTRTPTGVLPLRPERSASANFATSAWTCIVPDGVGERRAAVPTVGLEPTCLLGGRF